MLIRWIVCLLLLCFVSAVSKLRIVSPLQALTIWDPEVVDSNNSHNNEDNNTRRGRYLQKYKAGLQAEAEVRKEYTKKRQERQQNLAAAAAAKGPGWAQRAERAEREWQRREDRAAEAAYDRAIQQYETKHHEQTNLNKNPNRFQFVGVIRSSAAASSQPNTREEGHSPITWYAREKPQHAKWSVRLVHANRPAILKDLFGKGAVDVFAKYQNRRAVDETTGLPIIDREYQVRDRSWRNLWNFSPKHFLTDSSGMYWRERRLRSGLYTDGRTVYEATYRYRDGRNGMRKLSTLERWLAKQKIFTNKDKILKRLQTDTPDVVLEEP